MDVSAAIDTVTNSNDIVLRKMCGRMVCSGLLWKIENEIIVKSHRKFITIKQKKKDDVICEIYP